MSAIKTISLLIFILASCLVLKAKEVYAIDVSSVKIIIENDSQIDLSDNYRHTIIEKKYFRIGKKIFKNPLYRTPQNYKKDKVSTIVIILLTGPLGGHRLYLGTKPIVPIAYAVTLGGGVGVLPLIDLFAIAFARDLNRYINNDQIIMWIN